jgi:hypothetical protein
MDEIPRSMRRYLDYYGWHFNKPAYEYAASLMWKEDKDGKKQKVEPAKKEDVDRILKENNVEIENKGNWDYMYWAQQAKADLMPGAIDDDAHYAKYIKMMTDDPDVPDDVTMRVWYAKMVASGRGIPFEEFLD